MQPAQTALTAARGACMQRGHTGTHSCLMRIKMKSELLVFSTVMVIMSAVAVAESKSMYWDAYPTTTWTTRGPGFNLKGKMFTLSQYRGGIRFYSPYQPSPWYSTPYPSRRSTTPYYTTTTRPTTPYYTHKTRPTTPYYTHKTRPTTPYYTTTTRPTTPYYTTTTRPTTPYYTTTTTPTTPTTTRATYTTTYPPRTTAPATRGVSVCLRYIADFLETSYPSIFTLSPSSAPLRLDINNGIYYSLTFNGYNGISLRPNIKLWSGFGESMWTSVCFTVDSVKGVAQMFSNTNMSIRKVLPCQYAWSGESVIDFTGFDGQVTDVEVWDYPLRYKQVLYYMSRGIYGPYQGSMLTWSYISYSLRGETLLEDSYEEQIKQPSNRGARGHRLKWKNMDRKLLNEGERNEKQMI